MRGLTQSVDYPWVSVGPGQRSPGGKEGRIQCRAGTQHNTTTAAAMTFWQENYTFIKEVYDTRWVARPWWAERARYLKQKTNYWLLFVFWYLETGGRFSCRTYFQRRTYYGSISLPQSSHRGTIIIKPKITPNLNSKTWMAVQVPWIL